MGKRSDFVRRERDWYPTPPEAVLPLLPHLIQCPTFVEPCAGDGALVRALQAAGAMCLDAFDIEPCESEGISARDALGPIEDLAADYIITNPPWDRAILHPMIQHFSAHLPTWLLVDADWMHTRQAAPFMPMLRKVVSVGRVKWISGSKMTGKDNCAWYLFDAKSQGPAVFVGRAAA